MKHTPVQPIKDFKKLPYQQKLAKVKLMVNELKPQIRFFGEVSEMLTVMNDNVHENVLEYIYGSIVNPAYSQTNK
jgi:extradiol dioxygenase family protein